MIGDYTGSCHSCNCLARVLSDSPGMFHCQTFRRNWTVPLPFWETNQKTSNSHAPDQVTWRAVFSFQLAYPLRVVFLLLAMEPLHLPAAI